MYTKIKLRDTREHILDQERQIVPSMSYDPARDLISQRDALEKKFLELLHMPEKQCDPIPIPECWDKTDIRFDELRFAVETEPGFYVPAHLLLPKSRAGKLPLMICLQGHNDGMHNSMAREPYPSKKTREIQGDRDFAIQAISRGYAALVMEQRGFGELAPNMSKRMNAYNGCHHLAWSAVLMGKTLLGDRLNDISRMIDAVEQGFGEWIDLDRICITGNSGGGTSSYYGACVDKRICAAMPASCFCTLVDSWGSLPHCGCAYVPDMLRYMEMADLAMLIAPRPLVLLLGDRDPINPIEKSREAFEKVKEILVINGAEYEELPAKSVIKAEVYKEWFGKKHWTKSKELKLKAGAYIFNTNQIASNVIIASLEPEVKDMTKGNGIARPVDLLMKKRKKYPVYRIMD